MSLLNTLQGAFSRFKFGKEAKLPAGLEFFRISDTLIDGTEVTMDQYKGDVLCVVNVASKWGLTAANYTQLIQLIDEYGEQGFKVLAFPCNQFMKQEPGTPEEITSFVRDRFGSRERMVMFSKEDVNGANARPVFTYLKNEIPFEDGTTNILWNFGKFLIDHEGKPVKRFGSKSEPNSMQEDIEALLAKRNETR
jgi:glutathione peroxidase